MQRVLIRLAAMSGIVGPLLLGATIIGLSILQYPFMRSLGWHPLQAPAMDWPSGLALGPYGAWMTGAFVICGAMLALFGQGLRIAVQPPLARIGAWLLSCAGLAMLGLAAPTDPTLTTIRRTSAGLVHDAAFVSLGVTLLPALVLLATGMRTTPRWRPVVWGALLVALALIPGFLFKGVFFYLFLVLVLAWFPLVATRLLG